MLLFVVGEITDGQRSPHWYESGHRCSSQDSTFGSVRTRGSTLGSAMRGTPVAGRPADVAAGDAPTVTRHAGERREVIVVPASSGAPLQGGQRRSCQRIFKSSSKLAHADGREGTNITCSRGEQPISKWERAESLGPGGCAHGNGTCNGTDSELTRSGGGAR